MFITNRSCQVRCSHRRQGLRASDRSLTLNCNSYGLDFFIKWQEKGASPALFVVQKAGAFNEMLG